MLTLRHLATDTDRENVAAHGLPDPKTSPRHRLPGRDWHNHYAEALLTLRRTRDNDDKAGKGAQP